MDLFDFELEMTENPENFTNDLLKEGMISRLSRRVYNLDMASSRWVSYKNHVEVSCGKVSRKDYNVNQMISKVNSHNSLLKMSSV